MIRFITSLKMRGKLLSLVLPLVIGPIFIVAGVIGYIANQQAYRGITKTSKDDLQHMSAFSLDLLNSHHQQFQVYKQDRFRYLNQELATLTALSYNLVQNEHNQFTKGNLSLETAKREARQALKKVNVGETGYIYAMTSRGHSSGRCILGSQRWPGARKENTRSFARDFSSSRRAPPNTTVNPCRSRACVSACVFMTSV